MHGQCGDSTMNRMTWPYVSKIYVCINGEVLWLNINWPPDSTAAWHNESYDWSYLRQGGSGDLPRLL